MVLSDIAFRCSLVKENEEKKVGKDKRDTLYIVVTESADKAANEELLHNQNELFDLFL